MTFFATAAKGTEPALRDELRELGVRGVRADRGGVHFAGDLAEGARVCLWSRIAVRVLLEVAEIAAPDGEALYEGVREVDWAPYLTADRSLAVRASCRSSALTHTQFIAQKTKDAIVDKQRDHGAERSSVDRDDPDVVVSVHLVRDRATLYVDLSGQPLNLRGYRARQLAAPLKETLAAAIVRLSGWDRQAPLLDPMCGSGTLAIEAALSAARRAPGLLRPRFGFERWALFGGAEASAMATMREEARALARPEVGDILASDIDPNAVEATRENAAAAGVRVRVRKQSVGQVTPIAPGAQILVNPPYGERLEETEGLFASLGAALARLRDHRVAVLAGTPRIATAIPMRPAQSFAVFNGPIECRLLLYEVRGN